MKHIALITVVLILFASPPVGAGEEDAIIRLLCNGDIETTTDFKRARESTSIDVLVNIQRSTVEINGYWGCLADSGLVLTNPNAKFSCIGEQPVEISEGEIKFSGSSNTPGLYSGQGEFSLNRYTGTFSASGVASAQPASCAVWSIMLVSAKLNCAASEKRKF